MYIRLFNLDNSVRKVLLLSMSYILRNQVTEKIVICPRECQSTYKRSIGFILCAMLNKMKSIIDPSNFFQYIPPYYMKDSLFKRI